MRSDHPIPSLSAYPRAVRCTAHCRSGGQCRGLAIRGATVCRMHGGAAPQVRAAAARRVATARLLRDLELAGYKLPDKTDIGMEVRQ
jgi:hypothetical protein